ncbi:MAG: ATP-binding domain-containing protein [Maricaulaceae bacterium]
MDIVYGAIPLTDNSKDLVRRLSDHEMEGTFYVGYPILTSADGSVEIDGLLISQSTGIVAFDLKKGPKVIADDIPEQVLDHQDRIYAAISSKLTQDARLINRRKLAVPITICTISRDRNIDAHDTYVRQPSNVLTFLQNLTEISSYNYKVINSIIERTTALRPKKSRSEISKENSKGRILKKIEQEIATLDSSQKHAAIEFPNGPQRIRGLAGSGKTIVLAMKASILHLKNPDWKIAISFYTRSLYQHLKGLVRRFSIDFAQDEPDWERLKVMHAWGSSGSMGLYSEMAASVSAPIRNFGYAKRFGFGKEFQGIIEELYKHIINNNIDVPKIYDAVLVDEAQDLPARFFELLYMFTKPPHRIIYAYDELQTLNELEMRSPAELFGSDHKGKTRVTLSNKKGMPKQDITLPVCYRNTHWNLTAAHGLGFGTDRTNGLIQMFETPNTWSKIGYHVTNGELHKGRNVTLERAPDATPTYFSELIQPDDAVNFNEFDTVEKEFDWVAKSIAKNLKEDELDHDDILVIMCDAMRTKSMAPLLMKALQKNKIRSHLVGVTGTANEIFSASSIAITHVYRAKGNEAPMVYVVGAGHCYAGLNIGTLRNILFTSMTRSRAWVRVSGAGSAMKALKGEFLKIRQNEFALSFKYPNTRELSLLRTRYKEVDETETLSQIADLEKLSELLPLFEAGRLNKDDLSPSIVEALKALAQKIE